MELNQAVVIVTGAGSGIGRALASEFARNGATAVCCGRNAENLDETVRLIASTGGSALAVPTDVTERSQVRHLVQKTIAEFGKIDVLFNNAGSFNSIAGVHEADPETWWHDVMVNLYGCFLCMRETLPHMRERNSGIIINMNGGRPPGGSAYAAGKAGLMELTRITALELSMLKSSVMIFGAGPGLVRTPMTELQAFTEAGHRWVPGVKTAFDNGTLRQPDEIARKTCELIPIAKSEWSGKYFTPDTDFAEF